MLCQYEQSVTNALVQKKSEFVKAQSFLTKKVRQVRFQVSFVIEIFLIQVIGDRLKQVMPSSSQGPRLGYIGNGSPT